MTMYIMLLISAFLFIASWNTVAAAVPSKPLNLAVVNITRTSVGITWSEPSNPSNLTGYVISISSTQDGRMLTFVYNIAIPNPLAHEITTNMNPDTSYTIKVRGKVGNGDDSKLGNWSDSVEFRTLALPSKPLNLTVVDVTLTSISITWSEPSKPSNLTGYDISWNNNAVIAGPNPLAHKLTGLKSNTYYTIKLRAMVDNGAAVGDWSDSVKVRTLRSPTDGPTAPRNLSVVNNTQGFVSIKWSEPLKPNNLSKYEIELSRNGSNPTTYVKNVTSGLATIIYDYYMLNQDTLYDVRVRGVNANNGDWSDKIQFRTLDTSNNGNANNAADKKEMHIGLFVFLLLPSLILLLSF